ncbi:MAG: hypothetical protein IAF58_16535 [Leptolyngbya sp.]|nr:hypothetical protein [Candidatus Melainabacteria bacterium]
MANMEATEVAAKVYDLTQSPNEALRAEINESIGQMSWDGRTSLTEELVRSNLLPSLLLEEMPVVDQSGNGDVEYGELVTTQSTPLAEIALTYANENWIGEHAPFSYDGFTGEEVRQLVADQGEAIRPAGAPEAESERLDGEPTEVAPEVASEVAPEVAPEVASEVASELPAEAVPDSSNDAPVERPYIVEADGTIVDANPMRADWEYEEAANAVPPIQLDVSNPDVVHPEPDITPVSEVATPQSILENPGSTTEQQLQAIKDMVASGTPPTSIVDEAGNTINVRMEVVPVSEGSDRSYVHMFAVDPETGREIPILRAISDGEGFVNQRSANGEEVSFVGTKWKKAHPDTMFGED